MNLLSPDKNYNVNVNVTIKCSIDGCPGYCLLDKSYGPYHADFDGKYLVAPIECTECYCSYHLNITLNAPSDVKAAEEA